MSKDDLCPKCGNQMVPLFHVEKYCPKCETEDSETTVPEKQSKDTESDVDAWLDIFSFDINTPKKGI
ncbi:MAG: hypothetical protein KDB74_06630 [Flavobacteriales bacterium]|nr:hypothetical protein [Flavobacteriales bacterium]